jgi:hypothetical protein
MAEVERGRDACPELGADSQEEAGCGQSERVAVHFYGPRSFDGDGVHRSPKDRLSILTLTTLLGPKGPWHCNLEKDGLIYDCNRQYGCVVYFAGNYNSTPTESIALDAKFDPSWFTHARRFQLVLSLANLLGFPVTPVPVNCVSAICRTICIPCVGIRTPRHLLEELQWSTRLMPQR